jgi:hypothetical protein
VIGTGSYEGAHVRLRYSIPDHLACVKVSTFAHSLAFCVVVQKFNCRSRDGIWILEGDPLRLAKTCQVPSFDSGLPRPGVPQN